MHPFTPIFVGYLLSLSGFMVMTITFLIAFLNGYHVVVHINRYNEATIEFILIPIILIVVIIGLIKTYRLMFYEVEVEE